MTIWFAAASEKCLIGVSSSSASDPLPLAEGISRDASRKGAVFIFLKSSLSFFRVGRSSASDLRRLRYRSVLWRMLTRRAGSLHASRAISNLDGSLREPHL